MDIQNLPHAFQEGAGYEPIKKDELAWPDQDPQDVAALKLVVQDLARSDQFIAGRMFPAQWNTFDRLWNFEVQKTNWDGTNVPRSFLGIPLVLEHCESILPQVTLGIFSDETPFQIDPRPGTTADVARANAALLSWELDNCKFREEFRKVAKSGLIYGTGIGKWGWESFTRKRKTYRRKAQPDVIGMPIGTSEVHTPQSDEVEAVITEETVTRPFFQQVNLRHIKVDPKLRTQDIRDAGYVIHVTYMGLDDVDQLREYEGYKNIPDRAVLETLANTEQTAKEQPYQNSTEQRGIDRDFRAMPRADISTADPLKQPFEVLEYWTADHVYTVLQRKLVIRNDRNEFGKIPFVSVSFIDVLDSFYGIGIARLIGNEQRLQQGVINNALDVLALDTGGVYIRKRGFNSPTQQIRIAPGMAIDVDDPQGFKPLEKQQGVLQDALIAMASSDSRAQRHTAANEMAVQGSMPSKGSNLFRTAAGVDMMTSGTGTRLQYFVENLANLVFVPVLEAFNEMNATKLKPSQVTQILSEELAQAFKGDPIELFNGSYKFKILASAKLQARRQMMQTLPMFFQFIANQPVMDGLTQAGKKINWEELVSMVFDATGWPNKQTLITDLTQEDMARMAQMNPQMQAGQMNAEKVQQDTVAKSQLIEQQNEDRVARDIIREQLKRGEGEFLGT